MHKTTLEQWAILEKVVELGSFVQAAEATHRSQSSVSYNLALLQERLGVELLRTEGRRAVLTTAGELLLAQVRPLLNAFLYVEARAATLHDGVRTRLDLVVDSIFPHPVLFTILKTFQQLHPATKIHLTQVLENDRLASVGYPYADVMVLPRREDVAGRGQWLMNIDFVAVAHYQHDVMQLIGPLSEEILSRYPQVRIAAHETEIVGGTSVGTEQWVFSTVDAAIEAVMYQVGYAWLPEYRIAEQLAAGVLQPLALSHGGRRATPMHLIVKKDLVPMDQPIKTLLDLFNEYSSK